MRPHIGRQGQLRHFSKADTVEAMLAVGVASPRRLVKRGDALANTHQDIEKVLGKVPNFLKVFPDIGLPGALAELDAIDFDDGALTVKRRRCLVSINFYADPDQVKLKYR